MAPVKALVTGGAGFIGSHLSEKLIENGYQVVVIDDFNDFYNSRFKKDNADLLSKLGATIIEGDIRNKSDIEKSLRGVTIVAHLAARAGVRPSVIDPMLYVDVNVLGTLNLLHAVKDRQIKNFILASSSSIYGNNPNVPWSEDDRVDHPISPYAATKKAAEHFGYNYSHLYNIPVTCLRFFTVYGPRQRPDLAIHKFTNLILSGKAIPLYGDGTTERDYTYVSDIVDGIVAAIKRPFVYEIINLGNNKPVSLKELVITLEKALGKKAKIEKLPPQLGDVSVTYADISKAERMLDYKPKVSFEEGVKEFVKWYKSK
jgi:UDP-glucuronate 4-epimerase